MIDRTNGKRVAITALGVVSPVGIGWAETARGLRAGRSGIVPVSDFDTTACRSHQAGRVPGLSTPGVDERWHVASRFTGACLLQLRQADPDFSPEAAVIGTTSGGMSYGESYQRAQLEGSRPSERASWLANYMPQKAVIDALSLANWNLETQIVANACASGTNAVGHAFRLVRSGLHRAVLCGGFDAISELVFVGFDALQASTPAHVQPFDRARSGLALGEGAALFALEEWTCAVRRGAPIIAEVTGYGAATDNHHLTQPHPSGIGPRLAMERALADARRTGAEVDYVNAHGTATVFNDATEGVAIAQVLGSGVPVSSTKAMTGHALGGAGAIEAAFSIIAMRERFLPPNLNYSEPDPAFTLDIVANETREGEPRRVLSNSFGFGGTNASILLELP